MYKYIFTVTMQSVLSTKYLTSSVALLFRFATIAFQSSASSSSSYHCTTNSFPRAKLEENCEPQGTDNVQGQISVHIFEAKWRLLCLLSIKYFYTRPHFGRPFFKAFKRQTNSVGDKNIVSLFKMFSSINFNNLLEIKSKRANVNRKN